MEGYERESRVCDVQRSRGRPLPATSQVAFSWPRFCLARPIPTRLPRKSHRLPKSASSTDCRVESVDYKGWKAQQISNRWVQLVIVPQNGGRLMQVTFDGHAYLFVNPKLAGKYMPPTQNQWFNYGGDKLWLLPEGDDDEQHWRGNSDLIDDGEFTFRKLSDASGCGAELTGQADPLTGVQFIRTIRLEPDSPHITFRASMKNISGHTIEWSMQSVSQYDTGNPTDSSQSNREIWGFTRCESIQWIFESLSRSHRACGESFGHDPRRWFVLSALFAPGG